MASEAAAQPRTRIVAEMPKNASEVIFVRLTDVGGMSLVDIRTFARSIRTDGEPRPTKNGVCIPRTKLRALINALQAAEAA